MTFDFIQGVICGAGAIILLDIVAFAILIWYMIKPAPGRPEPPKNPLATCKKPIDK